MIESANEPVGKGTMPNSKDAAQAHTFLRLTLGAVATTFLMIVIGAVTRVTESGYGCGPYWPSCNGLLIPEFENIAV
ncbi:MAG: hypothetical protein CUN49_17340, partial [Candidatus Thermofonsia Clade 1 bacterium]